MGHAVAVAAMVRPYNAMVLLVVLAACILPVAESVANSIEREATVELLPNDLISEPNQQTEEETIANPVQVIENHVSKAWQAIVRQVLEEARAGLKYKRNLGGNRLSMTDTLLLFMTVWPLINSGVIPMSALTNGLPAPPVPLQTVPSMGAPGVPNVAAPAGVLPPTNMVAPVPAVASMGTGMAMGGALSGGVPSLDGSNGLPDTSAVQDMVPGMGDVPGASMVENMVPGSDVVPLGGNGLPGASMVPGTVANNPIAGGVLPPSGAGLPGAGDVSSISNYAHVLPPATLPGGNAVPVNVPAMPGAGSGLPNHLAPPGVVPASYSNFAGNSNPLSGGSGPLGGSAPGQVAGNVVPSSLLRR